MMQNKNKKQVYLKGLSQKTKAEKRNEFPFESAVIVVTVGYLRDRCSAMGPKNTAVWLDLGHMIRGKHTQEV
jgi:hypothetical protein